MVYLIGTPYPSLSVFRRYRFGKSIYQNINFFVSEFFRFDYGFADSLESVVAFLKSCVIPATPFVSITST